VHKYKKWYSLVMVKNISPKQRRIVKAKIKGAKNKDIGAVEYPNATPDSQGVLVSRELNKSNVAKYYEQSKLIALKNSGLDWTWIIDRLQAAGDATKQNNFTGEITPDHTVILSSVKQVISLLDSKNVPDEVKQQIQTLPDGVDEVHLVKLIKSR
jgi:hypothetical protein